MHLQRKLSFDVIRIACSKCKRSLSRKCIENHSLQNFDYTLSTAKCFWPEYCSYNVYTNGKCVFEKYSWESQIYHMGQWGKLPVLPYWDTSLDVIRKTVSRPSFEEFSNPVFPRPWPNKLDNVSPMLPWFSWTPGNEWSLSVLRVA